MIVNQENLDGLYRGYSVIFGEAFRQVQPKWGKFVTEVPSDNEEEVYAWLGQFPTMRKWVGSRIVKNLEASRYTIVNESWESTVAIKRPKIEDDRYGIYRPIVQGMGQAAARHPDSLMFDLLKNGETNLCYDAKAFFAADHPVSGGTKSNYLTGAGTALSATSYGTARATLRSMVDDQGEPLEVGEQFLLVVPPALEETGRQILNADFLASGQRNVWQNSAELMVAERLADKPKAWCLLAIGMPIKPLILQTRKRPEFVAQDDPRQDNVFMNQEFRYGIDARYNGGYSLWQLGVKNKGEA